MNFLRNSEEMSKSVPEDCINIERVGERKVFFEKNTLCPPCLRIISKGTQ